MESKLLYDSIRKIGYSTDKGARESADNLIDLENRVAKLRDMARNTDVMFCKSSLQATADQINECRTSIIAMILSIAAQVNEEHEVVQAELRILSVSSTSRDVAMSIERCLEFSRKMHPFEERAKTLNEATKTPAEEARTFQEVTKTLEEKTKRRKKLSGWKMAALGLVVGAINTAIVIWIGLSLL